MPRKRDVLYWALFSSVAIDLCIRAHDVWGYGHVGWALLYAAGSLCAVMSVILHAVKCGR